jgi:hypothetical protein
MGSEIHYMHMTWHLFVVLFTYLLHVTCSPRNVYGRSNGAMVSHSNLVMLFVTHVYDRCMHAWTRDGFVAK